MYRMLKSLLAVLVLGSALLVVAPQAAEAHRRVYCGPWCGPYPCYRVYYPRRVVYRAYYPPCYVVPVYPCPAPVYPYLAPPLPYGTPNPAPLGNPNLPPPPPLPN